MNRLLNVIPPFFEAITASSMLITAICIYNNKPERLDYEYMKKLSVEEKQKYIEDYEESFEKNKKK